VDGVLSTAPLCTLDEGTVYLAGVPKSKREVQPS
jgi:hypothetical protein